MRTKARSTPIPPETARLEALAGLDSIAMQSANLRASILTTGKPAPMMALPKTRQRSNKLARVHLNPKRLT
jgi:hypothetical protein